MSWYIQYLSNRLSNIFTFLALMTFSGRLFQIDITLYVKKILSDVCVCSSQVEFLTVPSSFHRYVWMLLNNGGIVVSSTFPRSWIVLRAADHGCFTDVLWWSKNFAQVTVMLAQCSAHSAHIYHSLRGNVAHTRVISEFQGLPTYVYSCL